MRLTQIPVLYALLTLSHWVLAQDDTHVYMAGSPGVHNWGLFTAAGQSPNMTRSVTFPGIDNETWTWRVNITNVAVPDARQPFPGEQPPLVDPHVVYMTYDFQWPGGGTLNEKINQSDSSVSGQPQQVCMTTYWAPVRSQYANRYQESDNGDCSSVFGGDCTAAFLSALRPAFGGQCRLPQGDPMPDECRNRVLPPGPGVFSGASTSGLGNGTAPNGTDVYGRPYNETTSGGPVLSRQGGPNNIGSAAVNGTNTTLLDNELSYVQMMALTGLPNGQPRLMCMRVNLERTSAGHSITASMVSLMGLAVMSVLFAML